jgi:hypothetical protein
LFSIPVHYRQLPGLGNRGRTVSTRSFKYDDTMRLLAILALVSLEQGCCGNSVCANQQNVLFAHPLRDPGTYRIQIASPTFPTSTCQAVLPRPDPDVFSCDTSIEIFPKWQGDSTALDGVSIQTFGSAMEEITVTVARDGQPLFSDTVHPDLPQPPDYGCAGTCAGSTSTVGP